MMEDKYSTVSSLSSRGLNRRQLLQMIAAGVGAASLTPLLAACSGDDDDQDDGNATAGEGDDEDPNESNSDEGSSEDGGGSEEQQEVIIAQGPEIADVDGTMSTGMLTFNLVQHYMEPLVHRNADFELVPFLATETEQVDDVTLRVTLREDAVFHNGDPVTAEDVVFTFERISDPDQESDLLRYVRTFESAVAVDERTVDLTLTEPDSTFPLRLALIPIVPKSVVEELGDTEFASQPMGSGAYEFIEWERGERVRLEKFADHWGEPAKIPRITFRGIPEDSTRVAELQTGAADIITNVPNHVVPEIEQAEGIHIKAVNSLRTMFALMNSHKAPFDDVRMRQAVNYAVDVQLIVDEMLDGYGQPATQPFGPEVFGFNPDVEGRYDYNPDEARRLMEDAGYADGVEINFFSTSGRYLRDVEVSQNIAAQLEEVGFTVNLNLLEFQAYFDNYINLSEPNNELDIGLWSNANNTGDADYNLALNVHSGGRGIYWNDPEVDELIDTARQTFDQDERRDMYHRIVEIMVVEQAAWLFLYTQHDIYGVSERLANWEPRADEMIYLRDIELRS